MARATALSCQRVDLIRVASGIGLIVKEATGIGEALEVQPPSGAAPLRLRQWSANPAAQAAEHGTGLAARMRRRPPPCPSLQAANRKSEHGKTCGHDHSASIGR